MVLWLLAYVVIGQVAVPIGLSALGLDRDELSVRGHAILHLCLDLSQLGVTLLILRQCLGQFRPRKRGFFPIKWVQNKRRGVGALGGAWCSLCAEHASWDSAGRVHGDSAARVVRVGDVGSIGMV